MGVMTSQITSLAIVYKTGYSGADQRKHQSSASLAFVRGIHRWPVNCPQMGPVTRKMFPFDDVIMITMYLHLPHERVIHLKHTSFSSPLRHLAINFDTILWALKYLSLQLPSHGKLAERFAYMGHHMREQPDGVVNSKGKLEIEI